MKFRTVGWLLAAMTAGAAFAVPEVVTDVSGYVRLTADDPGGTGSFASGANWSDGAAPSADKDYIVQGNHVMRVLGSAGTFQGRSLTLDNGRLKTSCNNNATITFPDLRLYGGRVEQSTASSSKTLAGHIHVLGTADNPSRISGSSGRDFLVQAALHGGAANVLKVMMTEEDAGSMNSTFMNCWLNQNCLATYGGSFVVEAGSSTTGWGRRIALCTRSLNNLGTGDPDAATSVITLKNRAAFFGSNMMNFGNPKYSIAIDGTGTLGGLNATGAEDCGVKFGGGVKIRGAQAGETVYVLGDAAAVILDNVVLENIGELNAEKGALRLGPNFVNPDGGPRVVATVDAVLQGTTAAGGDLTLEGASAIAPGGVPGEVGTLTFGTITVTGTTALNVDISLKDGVLSADRLVATERLVKGANGQIVLAVAGFPTTSDWEGSVRLLTAPNLGEADGFCASDFALSGLPSDWTDNRTAGEFSIETDGDTKHLVWTASLTETPVVRILPLGDSITYGSKSSVAGYRQPLYDLLVGAGYRPDFLGTLRTSEGQPVSDPDHEGHRGWVIARDGNPDRSGQAANGYDGLYEHVEEWLDALDNPHFILLHIGTNDLLGNDFAHAKDRLDRLVERLAGLRPAAWIVVTTLLDRSDSAAYSAAIAEQFNPYVAGLVARHRAIGRRVAYLDLNAAVPVAELADGVHPNDAGYAHMAEAWFGAICALMPSPMAVPGSTLRERVTLTGVNASGTSSWNTALQWDSGLAPAAGFYYFVPTNTVLRTPDGASPKPFAGESLVLNGGNVNLKHGSGQTASANWVVYGGSRIAHGNSSTDYAHTMYLGGTFDVRGTFDDPVLLSGSGAGGDRWVNVSAAMAGGPDACVRMTRTAGEADAGGKGFTCIFSGDNAAYSGRFRADSGGGAMGRTWNLNFGSQRALGAPVADGAKITLADGLQLSGSGLALTNGLGLALEGNAFLQPTGGREISGRYGNEGLYLGQGLTVAGSGTSVVTLMTGSSTIVLDDVTFTGVAGLVTEGWSTLRVYPGYNQPDLPIALQGNFADSSDGIGPVTLRKGGYLQPGVGTGDTSIGRFGVAALTVEDGGYLVLSVVSDENGLTNDFVRVYGNLTRSCADPIEIRFDRFPHNLPAGTRIPLLAAANLGTDVTAADFRAAFVAEYLDKLVSGTFEIAPVDGTNTLFFVQSSAPAVRLVGKDVSGTDSWANGRNWDSHAAPSAGFDYVVAGDVLLRRSTGGDPVKFAGRSLSVADGGDFAINGQIAEVDDLRLFSDGILSTRNDGDANRLRGTATVYAAKGAPFNFEIEASGSRTLNLEATFRGSGDLRFRYYHSSFSASGSGVKTFYLVTGESPDFTGGVELHQRAVCTDFRNELAMGGPAPAFRADRLLISSNATLRCSASYVMSDPSRGITFGGGTFENACDGGTIEVMEDQTLVISNRIAGTTSLRKTGPGTLVLCCATNTFSGTVRNQHEGAILAVGHADALAKANLQGFANAIWRIDDPAGLTVKGLGALEENLVDGNRALLVRPGVFGAKDRPSGKIVANLVRFQGATAADAEAALEAVRLDASELGKAWKTELVTEAVDGALLVKAVARQLGSAIFIR